MTRPVSDSPDLGPRPSPDLSMEAVARLRALFPHCATERRDPETGEILPGVDFDLLRQALGQEVVEGPQERYRLDWPGKRAALRAASAPVRAALRPDRAASESFATTANLVIEGDNLDALKLLRDSYLGRVGLIYIDPPYNTGRNLIYRNDWTAGRDAHLRATGEIAPDGDRMVANPRTNGRFHSDWLSMIYPRLLLARSLLSPGGVLACAIDENEVAALSLLLREIFGEDAYEHACVTVVHNPRGQQGENVSWVNEYLIFVYPSGAGKVLADFPKAETDVRNLRDSGTGSARGDARTCFYPFLVREGRIVGLGEVPPDDHHPGAANVRRPDGTLEVWPVTDRGEERKWRYARASVGTIMDKLSAKMGRASVQILFAKDAGTMRSLWTGPRYDASEYGTKLLEDLLPGAGFTYPKSLWAVRDAVYAATARDPEAIVLDFFAGSGTTAHAVMQLNAEDGGNRRFILVQAPEPAGEGGFGTIADITRERVRRAGAALAAGPAHGGWRRDTGFRALRVDTPGRADPAQPPGGITQSGLAEAVDTLRPGRTDEDLLFEVLAERGFDLSLPVAAGTVAGLPVLRAGDDALLMCCADGLSEAQIAALAAQAPRRLVLREAGFASDTVKLNAAAILAEHAPGAELWLL